MHLPAAPGEQQPSPPALPTTRSSKPPRRCSVCRSLITTALQRRQRANPAPRAAAPLPPPRPAAPAAARSRFALQGSAPLLRAPGPKRGGGRGGENGPNPAGCRKGVPPCPGPARSYREIGSVTLPRSCLSYGETKPQTDGWSALSRLCFATNTAAGADETLAGCLLHCKIEKFLSR